MTAAGFLRTWGGNVTMPTKGLNSAASAAGLRIVARTMGACSPGGFPDAVRRQGDAFWTNCAAFNDGVLASIQALQREYGLTGVVVAGEWSERWTGWDRQLEAQVNALRRSGLRIVLVRDVPVLPADFVTCALWRGADACALPRTEVEHRAAVTDAVLTRIAAGKPDVLIWSPLDALCPERRCPAVMGGRLLYRNPNHLTIDGSALLAPAMASMLDWLAEAPPIH